MTIEPIIARCTDIVDDEDCDDDDNDNDNDGYDDAFPTMPISQSGSAFSLFTRTYNCSKPGGPLHNLGRIQPGGAGHPDRSLPGRASSTLI